MSFVKLHSLIEMCASKNMVRGESIYLVSLFWPNIKCTFIIFLFCNFPYLSPHLSEWNEIKLLMFIKI